MEIEHILLNHKDIKHIMNGEIAAIISEYVVETEKVRSYCVGCEKKCKLKYPENWKPLEYNANTFVCDRKKLVIKTPRFGQSNQYKVLCGLCRPSHVCKSCERVCWSPDEGYINCSVLHSEHALCNGCSDRYYKKIEDETGVMYAENARSNRIVCTRCYYKDNVNSKQRASYLYGKMAASSMATTSRLGTNATSSMMAPSTSMMLPTFSMMATTSTLTELPDIR